MQDAQNQPIEGAFSATLAILDQGRKAQELDTDINRVLDAVEATGKKGSLWLQIDVRKGRAGQLDVSCRSRATVPEPRPSSTGSSFFRARDGSLAAEDPDQKPLPLTEVTEDELRRAAKSE